MHAPGHVFVVDGDLTMLACDAWLLPTDDRFHVTRTFARALGRTEDSFLVPQRPWDDSERVRLHRPADDVRPALWLGRVGGDGAPVSWFVGAVAEFVASAAPAAKKKAPGRPPLLAVNIIGTGHGGAFRRKGEVLRELFECVYDAANAFGADIVVVAWGAKSYAAAQRARKRALEARGDVANAFRFPHDHDLLTERALVLAQAARRGRLALFFGAGASAGSGLPGWSALLRGAAERLAPAGGRAVGADRLAALDPRDQATILARRYETAGLDFEAQVCKAVDQETYALTHALLASLPVRERVTTNFDLQHERAAMTCDRKLAVLPHRPDTNAERWLLKLHGSVDHPKSLVFTRASYLDASLQRGALFGLVQGMLLTRHMLFVGYSLKDEDFHELVHEVRNAGSHDPTEKRLGTAVALFDDPLARDLWTDDLDIVALRPETKTAPDKAAIDAAGRDCERFLDLVGYHAAEMTGFVLDDTYADMLTDDERELRELLRPLVKPVREKTGAGWQALRALLTKLGA